MKKITVLFSLLFSSGLFGLIEVGSTVPNMCWKDLNDATVCLDDYKETVRVLIYNAGY